MKSVPNSQGCPGDYDEEITGMFPGTQNYCHRLIGADTVGNCPKKSGGYTEYGLDPIEFNTMNGNKLCLKRGDLNYHQLAKQRGSSCSESE